MLYARWIKNDKGQLSRFWENKPRFERGFCLVASIIPANYFRQKTQAKCAFSPPLPAAPDWLRRFRGKTSR